MYKGWEWVIILALSPPFFFARDYLIGRCSIDQESLSLDSLRLVGLWLLLLGYHCNFGRSCLDTFSIFGHWPYISEHWPYFFMSPNSILILTFDRYCLKCIQWPTTLWVIFTEWLDTWTLRVFVFCWHSEHVAWMVMLFTLLQCGGWSLTGFIWNEIVGSVGLSNG